MSWRRAGPLLLMLAVLLAVWLTVRFANPGNVPSGIIDPAIEFYTRSHSASYGGIDRWAYYGMKVEPLAELLKKEGYVCRLPQSPVADDKLKGIHELACNKEVRWPLSRTLSIKASIDYDMRGRLVAANASSTLAGDARPVRQRMADFLRKMSWIEPEKLQIRGFEVDSVDTLSRLAVDTLLNGGGHKGCESPPFAENCAELARKRRASGFPPLPQGAIAVGNALTLHSVMERIRLLPVVPRTADAQSEDSLLVRVADQQIWMDFVGKDLLGRELMLSIALDSEGGAPVKLVAKVGADSQVLTLAGARRLANSGAIKFLIPEAGSQNPRFGVWLDMPNKSFPGTFKRLASELPNADPAFIPRVVKTIIASLSANDPPEETLGLYPALRSIEHRADILRLARADLWLPKEQSNRLIKQAYPDDPATRAAWALAICESAATPPVLDADCWQGFTLTDLSASALLRSEIAELQVLYALLELTHPLRLRLKRLSDTLPPD